MQNDIIRLIVIEESANEAEVIFRNLRKARYPIRPRYVEDDEDLQQALSDKQEWDLIISVPQVGDFTAAQVCEMVSKSKRDIPVIVLADDDKNLFELLNAGATQVVPSDNEACLAIVVGRELKNLAKRRQHQQLEQLYQNIQKQNQMLLDSSRDAIAYVHDGVHIYANPSYLKMFDYDSMDDLEGLPIMDLVSANNQAIFKDFMRQFMTPESSKERQIELYGVKSNGQRFKLKMVLSQAIYDSESSIQVIIHDQSWKNRDPSTGLFNSQHFLELLEEALVNVRETQTRSVLFYIALDNFNTIKEQLGVGGGEPVIRNIAKVIKRISEEGILARFSESVFTLLMADEDGQKYAEAGDIAEKICKAVEESVTELDTQSVVSTCSIGITRVLAAADNPQEVLNEGRIACQNAQEEGGNRFKVYKVVIPKDEQDISKLAKLIETAIEENRLSLLYQPVVSLHGESKEIFEIFLRMVDSDGETVPSGDLFQAAENANLSAQLDQWVIQEALKVLEAHEKNGRQTHFFIKLSAQAIKDEKILQYIGKQLNATQLPGVNLIFEIRESVAQEQIKLTHNFITQLKKLKCQSALEHFGAGLNFDTMLKHLPVDYIKIDASYSKGGLLNNPENQDALQEVVKQAREFGKQIIAVAVEDADSLAVLWSSEVNFAQGNYIQEPLSVPEFDFDS
jgi:diguanylate cyclase (GGDEF)-like protein/PAS domain S-box-containing protein